MRIFQFHISKNLNNNFTNVVFQLPDSPTIATFSHGFILKFKLSITISSLIYQKSTSLNSIFHSPIFNFLLLLSWTSGGVFKIANISVDSHMVWFSVLNILSELYNKVVYLFIYNCANTITHTEIVHFHQSQIHAPKQRILNAREKTFKDK